MRHGSLFSGIGGFDLAAEWMGWENVFQVEWDPYCQKVLAKNFPNVKRYGDIKEFKGEAGAVDILTGGFPCQPFSHAGKRKGESDDRYLWPEYLRVIREIKPAYVVGENVAGLVSMEDGKTLEGIFTDLEGEGYQVESFIIPACGVGAWHRRDRIWIVAYSVLLGGTRIRQYDREDLSRQGTEKRNIKGDDVSNTDSTGTHREAVNTTETRIDAQCGSEGCGEDVSDTDSSRQVQCSPGTRSRPGHIKGCDTRQEYDSNRGQQNWSTESNVGRVANGIPRRVDRLKGLGNAIVPQVALEIFRAIDAL
jgi:DNA (cytosine-5)-methyltransferase 1